VARLAPLPLPSRSEAVATSLAAGTTLALARRFVLFATTASRWSRMGGHQMRIRRYCWAAAAGVCALAVNPSRARAFNLGYHHDITSDVLRQVGFSDDAAAVVLTGNEFSDIFQADPSFNLIDDDVKDEIIHLADHLHFDQLFRQELIDKNFRLLVRNARATVANVHQIGATNLPESQAELLLALGISLHVTQDFYAHSNWAELDLPTFPGVPADATYWDMKAVQPNVIAQGIANYQALGLPKTEWGLFTHWSAERVQAAGQPDGVMVPAPSPHHNDLCKDWATAAHFDDAYRAAYKASYEWVRFFKHLVEDVEGDTTYWANVTKTPQLGDDIGNAHVFSGPKGTAQYLAWFAGAWKNTDEWPHGEIILADMPNVPGVNWWNANQPFLYPQWRAAAQKIADGVFEPSAYSDDLDNIVVEKIDGTQQHNVKSDVKFSELPDTSSMQAAALIDGDVTWLGTQAAFDYAPNWLKLAAPFDSDNDDGDGWFNINDEDPGPGASDYYAVWHVGPGNGPHTEYWESVNREQSRSINNWQTLLPMWDSSSTPVSVSLWDSDDVDWLQNAIDDIPFVDLDDDHMDISPSDDADDFSFTLQRSPFGLSGQVNGVKVDPAPYGYLIHTSGHDDDFFGDYTASVTLQASPMARNTKVRLTILEVTGTPYSPAWAFSCPLDWGGGWGCNSSNVPTCQGTPVQCAPGGKTFTCGDTTGLGLIESHDCGGAPLASGADAVKLLSDQSIAVHSTLNLFGVKPSDSYNLVMDGGVNPAAGPVNSFDVFPGWEQRWEGYLDWDTIPITFQITNSNLNFFGLPFMNKLELEYHMLDKTISGHAGNQQISGVDGGDILFTETTSAGTYSVTFRITVDPGVWGAQPPSQQVSEYFSADPQSPDDNQIRPRMRIRNKGAAPVPLSEFSMRYWYTSEGFQPEQSALDYVDPAIGAANVTTKFVKLRPRDGADGYVELGFKPGAGALAANSATGEIQLRFNKSDWSNYHEPGDYSYNPAPTTYVEAPKVTLYRNNVLIYGTEPEPLAQSQIVQKVDVFMKDEAIGESNIVKPRFYAVNTGNVFIGGFHLRYFFTVENGKTPVLENYYLPNVTATLENLGNNMWDVDYHYVGMGFGPTTLVPDSSGFVSGIHYSDWSAFDKSNDYSNPGSGSFIKATQVQVSFD
jgi:hypothetical protein